MHSRPYLLSFSGRLKHNTEPLPYLVIVIDYNVIRNTGAELFAYHKLILCCYFRV